MIPELIPEIVTQTELCALAGRWKIHPKLAYGLYRMAYFLPFRISIISGFRTVEAQEALADSGRPAAPPDISTHTTCPATGADLRVNGLEPGSYEKSLVGEGAARALLRWGGGSQLDQGIPIDWNHVDLGRRAP